MAEQTLQEKLIAEFFDSRYFPSQHDFAARAEILALRERVKELEKKCAKGEKGSTAKADKSE
jgi:hypothetical protein